VTAALGAVEATLDVLIVDDEPLVREAIRGALHTLAGVRVVGECGDGMTAIESAQRLRPDVILLDVQMPELTGIEVAAALYRETDAEFEIIFVTAHDQYAVRAFELNAVDFILKPFDDERIHMALERARRRCAVRLAGHADAAEGESHIRLAAVERALLELQRPGAAHQRFASAFVVNVGRRLRVVPVQDVRWIEAADNYVYLHTAHGQPLLRETMRALEARLDPDDFVRVHRSAIVRLSQIQELRADGGESSLQLACGDTVPLSRTYRDHLLRRLG
jgi:two-component system LytT family response regulator